MDLEILKSYYFFASVSLGLLPPLILLPISILMSILTGREALTIRLNCGGVARWGWGWGWEWVRAWAYINPPNGQLRIGGSIRMCRAIVTACRGSTILYSFIPIIIMQCKH